MSRLPDEDRATLIRLGRAAIHAAVHGANPPTAAPVSTALSQPSGAFVTLHRRGRLRGCLGQVEPSEPLVETVMRCAVAAAREDPRFAPVRPEELLELEIEISVLSALQAIRLEQIEVGTHGLMVSLGRMRGLLLPQVAVEYHWTRERFFEETCKKAGLARDAWKDPVLRIEAFTAEVFSEHEVSGRPLRQAS
jgi:AmmeMemoRadiSam system protein A